MTTALAPITPTAEMGAAAVRPAALDSSAQAADSAPDRHLWKRRHCRYGDPDRFFSDSLHEVWAAQNECASCPALRLCAQNALRCATAGDAFTYCVIASVLTPVFNATQPTRNKVVEALRKVAMTGIPAPHAIAQNLAARGISRTHDPQFQDLIHALRTQGIGWRAIAEHVRADRATVRTADRLWEERDSNRPVAQATESEATSGLPVEGLHRAP
ncbi:hypothetical protein ACWDUL_33775 [Nocardia niigatensis]